MTSVVPVFNPELSEHVFENQRSEEDFSRAERHSARVTLLRKALPIAAIVIIVGFVAISFVTAPRIGNVSVESADIEGGKLIMNSPVMAGFDEKNRPYDVKARRAIQDLSKPNLVKLEEIDAVLPSQDGGSARIKAQTGDYDTEKETLKLLGKIDITTSQAMVIKLQQADIDMKTGTLNSSKPVRVTTTDTTITSDQVEVTDNGKNILFRDRVRMTIKPNTLRGTK